MLIAPQSLTERALEAHCAQLGAEIVRGAEMVGLSQDADGVTLTVAGPAGSRTERAPGWVLDSYESERHPVGAMALRLSHGLTRAALVKSDLLRDLAISTGTRHRLSVPVVTEQLGDR